MAEQAKENDVYQPVFEKVKADEEEYVNSRREKAAAEFSNLYKAGKHPWYTKLLKETKNERPSIGLALSGGGIRSATFNLGILQGLSKFGILPWVDYLSSVSGGGYIAACITSLLSHEEKQIKQKPVKGELNEDNERRYYPFNAFWERFPFNPKLQVFDVEGVAYDLEHKSDEKNEQEFIEKFKRGEAEFEDVNGDLPLKISNGRKQNRQLEHLRNLGNYLIPRMGSFTVDTIRGLGAFFLRIAYTLSLFITAIITISAIHYAIAVAFTPEILDTFDLEDSPSILPLLFGAYDDTTGVQYPWNIYGEVFLCGLGFSFLIGLLVSFSYRKDPTADNRYRMWKSPNEKISTYSWIVISKVTALALILLTVLTWGTIKLWFVNYAKFSASEPYFYFTLLGLFVFYLLLGMGFIIHSRSDTWTEQGLPEQEWIDKLAAKLVVLITLWTITLLIASLKIEEGFNETFRIYWIWMPAVFLFGGGWGLILFQYLHFLQYFPGLISKWVRSPENHRYDERSIHPFARAYLRFIFWLKQSGNPIKESAAASSRGIKPYRFVIWSSPDFRSIFWTMQGLFMYGTLGFILFGAILIPHYFSNVQDNQTHAYIPLSVTLLTALWSSYIATSKQKADSASWLPKVLSLPPELKQTLLSLLVFVFNVSILYLIEIVLKIVSSKGIFTGWAEKWQFLIIAGVALVLILLQGLINANYLTAHYFYRDRIADAYLRTEVDDLEINIKAEQIQKPWVGIPHDDRDRLMSRILRANCSAPYHIVLAAINLGGSWFLQFKDRKSQPFIFSKEYSGSDITGYVKTDAYRGNSTKYSQAIALSGAAVSSGLGYITTFAYAFVITLLNFRLGLWLANPSLYKTEKKGWRTRWAEKFTLWLRFLWDETRGRMNERGELVNITDGAHTEDNIGLYPLFQRRCKYILAGDAGEDPEGKCENLMAVIRQAKIDLGIEVDINVEDLKPDKYDKEKKEAAESKAHFAIGRIQYPRDPKSGEKAWNRNNQNTRGKQKKDEAYDVGWLIYFRPSIVKDDPAPVLKYWQKHKVDFPHPSTADQFFDEEQFEVHRILGEWTVTSALKEVSSKFANSKKHVQLDNFLGKFIKFDRDDIPESFHLKDEKEKKKSKQKKTVKPVKFESLFEEYHKLSSHPKSS